MKMMVEYEILRNVKGEDDESLVESTKKNPKLDSNSSH